MCALLSHLPFSLYRKVGLLLAILLICLSSPLPWNMTARTSTTSLLSSPPLSGRWKLFFADKPLWVLSAHQAQACVAAFSSSVCCIFWFIYAPLIVAPRACQESQSQNLARALCGLNQIPIWNIHESMNIFIVELPRCILGRGAEFHFLRWPGTGVEWRDPCGLPTCRHQTEPLWCTFHTMEWKRQGKWFGSYWKHWSSPFKAVCLAKALTGLLTALDVRPVMSLWRARAALAGRLRLHCAGVGVQPRTDLRVGSFSGIAALRSALLK